MSFRIVQRVVVDCGYCDNGWGDGSDSDGPLNFKTVDAARAFVLSNGWTVRDGAMCCPSCKTKFVCKAEGHDVDEEDWIEATTKNGVPIRYRTCYRCSSIESDPPAEMLDQLDEAGAAVIAAAEQIFAQAADSDGFGGHR